MADLIQIRRDTAANWTSVNPVLANGELALETDTQKFKFGDGVTAWNSLPYSQGDTGLVADTDYLTPSTASTTYAPVLGADDNYVTDAEKVVIGNTSNTNSGDNAANTLYSGLVSATPANVKAINDRVSENTTVTGTQNIDWSIAETFVYTLTGACDFSDINLPGAGFSKVITIQMTGNFAPTLPTGWDIFQVGSYVSDGMVAATGTVTCATAIATETVTINGIIYTGVAGVKANNEQFSIDTDDTATALDLADSITNDVRANGVTATSALGVVTITATTKGFSGNDITLASNNGVTLAVSGALLADGVTVLNTITTEYVASATPFYKVLITQ